MNAQPETDNPPKNVLFITIDAWRASHGSFTPGPDQNYTPNLTKLAETSAVFTEAISHGPATPYAFPSIFTSTHPLAHGGYEKLSPKRTHVAQALEREGWTCIGTHANPWLRADYGYGRGYASYTDVGEFNLPGFDWMRRSLITKFGLDHPVYTLAQRVYRSASEPLRMVSSHGEDEISRTKAALAESQTSDDEPRFIWTHLLDPHAPYTPATHHLEAVGVPDFEGTANQLVTRAQQDPESLSGHEKTIVRKLYAAAVRHADERVGELLAAAGDETLIVVTADHGEALFEHGQVGHEPCVFDELVHIPLLVRPPGGLEQQTTVETQVRHIDIAPTILDYAGITPPASYRGESLRPLVDEKRRPTPDDDRLAVTEVSSTTELPGVIDTDALQIGVRLPTKKLIFKDGNFVGYDLVSDPDERSPVTVTSDESWKRLRDRLERRLEEIDFVETTNREHDPEVERRLRSLGYFE